MNKNYEAWKRGWKKRAGALALCGGMLIAGTSVVGAQENPQQAAVQSEAQLAEASSKKSSLELEKYLKQCWKEKRAAIDLTEYQITDEELNPVLLGISYEEPEYYWIIRHRSFEVVPGTEFIKTYYPSYTGEAGQPYDRSEELEREWDMVQEMTKNCQTDVEKALVVHDHIVRTNQYSASLGAFVAHDIEGAILEKKSVCEGYALAYKYYMNRLGIPCKVVSGVSRNQPHAWNQVKIDGKWYLVDATWDDGSCAMDEKSHPVKHRYFLKSEAEFSDDHTWESENYEICDDTKYDNVEWKWVSRKMCAYQGNVYVAGSFVQDDSVYKHGIWKYEAGKLDQPGELVLPIEDEWQLNTSNKGKGCMEIAYYDGALYYNTPRAVWKWNFDPETQPEKVFELESDVQGSIWYLHVADGKVYYETGLYSKSEMVKREYVMDANYPKVEQPIAVTSPVMTVDVKGSQKGIFLQAAAPGEATFKSNDPEICDVKEAYAGKSCELIPKKVGQTTITINTTGTDHYLPGTKNVTVIVKDDSSTEGKITLQYEAGANGSVNAVNVSTGAQLSNLAQIEPNTEVQFTAAPAEGYSVKNWTINGTVYKENGNVYTGTTLKHVITSSSNNVKVEFAKAETGFVKGDVDSNGKVDIGDVREALRSICKKTELTETQKKAGDINGNGTVDIEDLRTILRFVCGKIESL